LVERIFYLVRDRDLDRAQPWRQDNRRMSNGDQLMRLAGSVARKKSSPDFMGWGDEQLSKENGHYPKSGAQPADQAEEKGRNRREGLLADNLHLRLRRDATPFVELSLNIHADAWHGCVLIERLKQDPSD
jgi:hypothetical protein